MSVTRKVAFSAGILLALAIGSSTMVSLFSGMD
jgi:hypothetical protein